jgi:hypothetical protein
MPTDKQQALATINALPEDATLEEIVYRLHVVQRIRGGLGRHRGRTNGIA